MPLSNIAEPSGFRIVLNDGNDTSQVNKWGTDSGGSNCGPPCVAPSLPLTILGGAGNDTITGGPENDFIDGGLGADAMSGGAGSEDIVSYASRSDGVTINLAAAGNDDGSQNDGDPGSRDNINTSDIETVVGSDGPDTITGVGLTRPLTFEGRGGGDSLTGGSAPNILRGEGGNDTLTGGGDPDELDGGDGGDSINGLGAADIFRGGSGFDNIEARDGIADDVDCGPDDDSAFTDAVDTRVNCDPAPTDGGGGAGGGPAPTGGGGGAGGGSTTTALQRLLIIPSFSAHAGSRGTTLSKFTVKSIDRGSRLTAKCRTKGGKRCLRTRDYAKTNAPATLRLKGLENKSLPVGAKLEIRVTKPGMIGAVKVLTIRRGKKPTLTTRCMPPGASRPAQC